MNSNEDQPERMVPWHSSYDVDDWVHEWPKDDAETVHKWTGMHLYTQRPPRIRTTCPRCDSTDTIPILAESTLADLPADIAEQARAGDIDLWPVVSCIGPHKSEDQRCRSCSASWESATGGTEQEYEASGVFGETLAELLGPESVAWTDYAEACGFAQADRGGLNLIMQYWPDSTVTLLISDANRDPVAFTTKLIRSVPPVEGIVEGSGWLRWSPSLGVHGELNLSDRNVIDRWPNLLGELWEFWLEAVLPWQEDWLRNRIAQRLDDSQPSATPGSTT